MGRNESTQLELLPLEETIAEIAAETEALAAGNSSFSTITPGLQLAWDSTSLGALKRCPKYYELSIIRGYVSRQESVHLTFGIAFHSALEFYNHRRAEGIAHEAALIQTLRHVFVLTWRFDLSRPWPSDDPHKNRETLVRSVVWYLDQFENDPLETFIKANGSPAVELSFRLDLEYTTDAGEVYQLCGHLDKAVTFQGHKWIVDRKTTKSMINNEYFEKYSPDNQMSVYSLAGTLIFGEPVAGLIINAAQIGATFARFQRGQVIRTEAQLHEWLERTSTLARFCGALCPTQTLATEQTSL